MYSVCVGVHLRLKSIKSRGDFSSITELIHTHTYACTRSHTQAPFIKREKERKQQKSYLASVCLNVFNAFVFALVQNHFCLHFLYHRTTTSALAFKCDHNKFK